MSNSHISILPRRFRQIELQTFPTYIPSLQSAPSLRNLQNMASYESQISAMITSSRHSMPPIDTHSRRASATSNASPTGSLASPRVQLVPHARTVSYDGSLSLSDMELLANTNFDAKDMSSKDFDFDDVFTYDKPQKKLKSIVEVCTARDWSQVTSSHCASSSSSSAAARHKHSRGRSTASEMYKKNRSDARK